MNTINKIIYLSEEFDRKKILDKIKNVILGAVGAAMMLSSGNAYAQNPQNFFDNTKQAIVSHMNIDCSDGEYIEKEINKIQKRLIDAQIPAEELKKLEDEIKKFSYRMRWDSNFMSRADKNKLIIKKYNEGANKLIYEYSNKSVKDKAKRLGQKSKRAAEVFSMLFLDDVHTISNILTVFNIKPYKGETSKELIRRRAEKFLMLQLANNESKLYDLGLTDKDIDRIIESIKDSYEEIAPNFENKKDKAFSFARLYKNKLKEKLNDIDFK